MSMLVLVLVVREVVGQGVGVAEAAVAGDDGGATAVELLHQIHLFKVRPSVEIVMYTYYTPAGLRRPSGRIMHPSGGIM